MNRFLATTALEETWPENPETPVLFLGEWCRLYSRKDHWSQMNAEVLPYHWDDRGKLYRDYLYIRDLYERVLKVLTEKLNNIHSVDHGLRYWRILVGPWLGYFLQILFDRWETIRVAVEQFEPDLTIIQEFPEESMIPQGMNEFTVYFTSDEWNHFLYSRILQQTTKIKCQIKSVSKEFNLKHTTTNQESIGQKLKKQIAKSLFRALSQFGQEYDAFFMSTYLSSFTQWKLDCKLKQLPQLRRYIPVPTVAFDLEKRDWTLNLESKSEFEQFSAKILAHQIPSVYLEGYFSLLHQIDLTGWPQRPKVIWTSNADNSDDLFKAYAAEKVEKGSPLVIGQHGGHYGMGLWSFSEDHHLAISDRYFSWGWTEGQQSKIRPMGRLKQNKRLVINHAKQNRLLLLTTTIPRYSYWMFSSYVSRQWLDYLNDQFAFCLALTPKLRTALKVRLYPKDYNWEQLRRWKDHWPDVELDPGKQKIDNLMRECRIFISSYNATTYLESFIMNVPTVLFWNPSHWELRDSAKPYFEVLKEVGIFHEKPESAAHHIINIWDNVDKWWTSKPVSDAVNQFCEIYSKTSKDIVHDLYKELNELTTKHEHVQ